MSTAAEERFQAHERVFELLECLPERTREWNLCREAACSYVTAGEPPYQSDFGEHLRKPLWQLIGQALEVGGKPAGRALGLLEEIRTGVQAKTQTLSLVEVR